MRGYRHSPPNLRLRPFGVGLNWFPRSICVSEASPTACDFHSRPTGFPKRSFQNQFQRECKVCLAGLACSRPFLFRRTRRTPKFYTTQPLKGSLVDVEERNIWPQHATAHDKPKTIQNLFFAVVSGSNEFHYLHSLVIFTLKGLN